MSTLPKILESNTKIRFQHCDPFNHLNNGIYIDYFMNHREDELITNYDLDIYKIAKTTGKSWVSSSNQIVYLKPAFLMETVVIQSQLIHFNDSELHVEMRMYNEDKSHLKAVLWASFVHFNLLEQKREKHAQPYMDLFTSVHTPLDASFFEERVKHIKSGGITV
jgi:acyl-CoA thioester hydrolase